MRFVNVAIGIKIIKMRYCTEYQIYKNYRVQTGSGAHPASYPMGTRGSFPEGKAAGA
jgi:hypothetical protein